jgi:hypothetical protein
MNAAGRMGLITQAPVIIKIEEYQNMGCDHLGFDRFAVGQRFRHVTEHRWSGQGQSGTERTEAIIEVSELCSNRFDYRVVQVLHVDAPLPGTNGRTTVGSLGGIAYGYAIELMARGQLVPVSIVPAGWIEVSTGGGCTAWQRDLYDADDKARRIGSALITMAGDAMAPQRLEEPVTLGIYDADDVHSVLFDCPDVAEAVMIAARFTTWA